MLYHIGVSDGRAATVRYSESARNAARTALVGHNS